MSVKVFATQEVQDLLKVATNLQSDGGNARAKEITHRLLSDLFKAIDELEKYLDIRMDAADKQAEIEGGTARTIEGLLYVEGAPVRDGMSKIDIDIDIDADADADADAGPLVIRGVVTGPDGKPDGKPVANAVVECWHANSKGFYSHFNPTGAQSDFNLRGAVKTGEDGRYEFRTLMPVGYGCPPHGSTQQLLNVLGRHGNRPAHVHFFVTADTLRKLTTQINIEGDPLIWDDFAYATREDLIPHVMDKRGGTALGMKEDAYKEIEFDIALTPLVQGKDNQLVNRLRATAAA
ncbi:Catechol 1,2-dioxygenase [Candidatus Burkholderia humilis]|nr:Catechol 1,2-dioxygenase [Candidatus Burkholderia humilis]